MTHQQLQLTFPALYLAVVALLVLSALEGCERETQTPIVYIERQCPATEAYAAWLLECTKGRPSIQECQAMGEQIFCRAVEVDGGAR